MILAVAFLIFSGGILSCIQLSLLTGIGNWRYTVYIPSDSYENSYDDTHDRTSVVRPMALPHVQSSDHLVFHAILSHYLTTLAFIVQHLHIDARYIARFNAFISHNGRSESFEFHRVLFHMRLVWQQFANYIYFFGRLNILSLQLVRQL